MAFFPNKSKIRVHGSGLSGFPESIRFRGIAGEVTGPAVVVAKVEGEAVVARVLLERGGKVSGTVRFEAGMGGKMKEGKVDGDLIWAIHFRSIGQKIE